MDRVKPVCAVHLFLIHESRILLLRRFNTGYEDGKYSVIAGHLNGDEEIKAAAIRDAQDEVGVEVSPVDVRVVGVTHRKSNNERIDLFLATDSWSREIANGEPHKCDRLAWFPMTELPDNVVPYVRRALSNTHQGIWLDSFGWPQDPSTVAPGVGRQDVLAPERRHCWRPRPQ
jgi:8-oxo-dGTP diphosphatase